jgi:hypothetical protein
MTTKRLLKLKHERRELGFMNAQVMKDESDLASWLLHVESPADLGEFRRHLATGSTMTLSMVTRDGDHLRGEAAVATVSDCLDAATVVTLAGLGPLYQS